MEFPNHFYMMELLSPINMKENITTNEGNLR